MTDDEIRALAGQMTLEEQVSLLSGEDFWSLPAIPRLGIGKLRVTDGPNGARGGGGLIGGVKSAAFPVGICLGSSWDVALVREVGSALAEEVKSKGAHVSLSPTVNIHRSVTNGRNFECYSEDPVLTAKLAGGFIDGLQSRGISATIKHFVGNESEIERTTINSVVDERALREVYLLPFEHAVKHTGTWAIMASYNRLNGTYTSESEWLLTKVLRQEWQFDGVVMSDWFGSHSTAPTVNAGLDLEMPGPARDRGGKLIAAVEAGGVSADTVRERAADILRLMQRTGALHDHTPYAERADDNPAHRTLIRRAGAAGTVLLKNDGVLPLTGTGTIAVIGPNAKSARIMGGGSAQLNPHYMVSPWDGLVAALGVDRLSYAPGSGNERFEPLMTGAFEAEYFGTPDLRGPVMHHEIQHGGEAFMFGMIGGKVDTASFSARYTTTYVPDRTATYRVGVASAGYTRVLVDGRLVVDNWTNWERGRTYFEEGSDEATAEIEMEAGRTYTVVLEFGSKPAANLVFSAFRLGLGRPLGDADIAEAVAAAKAADIAVVFAGRTGEWDTEGADLPNILLPGRQDELIHAVARANPHTVVVLQTGGPVEMGWLREVAAVLEAWYPGQEAGNAIADVLTGASEPGGRLPQTFPVRWADNPTFSQDREIYPGLDGQVRYEEGVFVGYRHYDRWRIAPQFPFGFGLSYTRFEYAEAAVDASHFADRGIVSVAVSITNVGARAGSDVVQVYVGDPEASVPRPAKELKAFAKVHLQPGESQRVTLELGARDLAFFSVDSGGWVVEPGRFDILIGRSSAEILARIPIEVSDGLALPV